jgi:hypothetical protein
MSVDQQRGRPRRLSSIVAAICSAPLWLVAPAAVAEVGEVDAAIGFEKTPPRLSLVDGEASFWRPGADDWTQAQINTPLAAGDELYTGPSANLEIQVGGRAFVRAGQDTQIGIYALEPDYLQLRVAAGDLSLDLRSLEPGRTLEVNTPNAAFTVETAGYYRLTVDGSTSTFISRRGGRAVVTPASGASLAVGASERVVVSGVETPQVATYAAPDIDSWDRWNYSRTDQQIESVSARYVSQDVYGLADLDRHGEWRQVPTYGSVWVPRRVAVDWAPYSYGRWIHDPYYGWSWIDYAPWGWAPYHYGRWVHVSGFWGWCPGPVVVRPYYAPALVAFYGGPGVSVSVSIGAPFGWVALGWGEPLAPWWGPAHFRRHAWWGGWGGPRYVNNVHIHNKTIVHVDRIKHHEHARHRRGVVVVDRDNFGRRGVDRDHRRRFDVDSLRPVRGDLPLRPTRESLRGGDRPGRRPPREVLDRRVVATREPRIARAPLDAQGDGVRGRRSDAGRSAPPRIVQPTRRQARREVTDLRSAAPRAGRDVAPPLPGRDASRGERRAPRSENAARQRVDRSPSDTPAAAVRERRREAPPLASRDDAARQRLAPPSRSGGEAPQTRQAPAVPGVAERDRRRAAAPLPSRDDAARQRSDRPSRSGREAPQIRAAPEVAVRERRREAPPPLPRRDTRRVERAAPPAPQGDGVGRQRVAPPSRELRAAPAPAVRERRQPDRAARRPEAPAVTARREAPSYRQPERDNAPRPRAEAPVVRSAPRRAPDRSSSMRMPRSGAGVAQRAPRSGATMRQQRAPRMPSFGGGSSGGMRGQRRGGDGRR